MPRPLAVLYDYEAEPIQIPLKDPYPADDLHMASYAVLPGAKKGMKTKKIKAKLAVNKYMPGYGKKYMKLEDFHKMVSSNKPKYIVAHNLVTFDAHLMRSVTNIEGIKLFDTIILSRRIFTSMQSHALATWGMVLGYPKDDYSKKVKAAIKASGKEYNRGDEFKRKHIVKNFEHAAAYCKRDTDLMARIIVKAVRVMTGKKRATIADVTEKDMDILYKYIELETEAQEIMFKSQQVGYPLDNKILEKASKQMLKGKEKSLAKIQKLTGAGWIKSKEYTPVRKMTRKGIVNYDWEYLEASPYAIRAGKATKIGDKHYMVGKDGKRAIRACKGKYMFPRCDLVWKSFNPGSSTQVGALLMDLGWKPIDFTDGGAPMCGVKFLDAITGLHPVVKEIMDYSMLSKQYSAVAGGEKSLLNNYNKKTKRIHHLNQVAAASSSSRSSHIPNVSQVTRAKIGEGGKLVFGESGKWGTDMRYSFMPYPGHVQVGTDLSGLELRTLAEMLIPYDGGALMKTILKGDIHQMNADTVASAISKWLKRQPRKIKKIFKREKFKFDRNASKKSLYSFLYGAGNKKLGHDTCPWLEDAEKSSVGKAIREALFASMSGLEDLIAHHKTTVASGEYVVIFDGSVFACDKDYIILSRINQSTGARIALNWVVDSYNAVVKYADKHGLVMWEDVGLLGYFHDEMQWSTVPKHANKLGKLLTKQSEKTGKRLGFKIPIESEFIIGKNWAECH